MSHHDGDAAAMLQEAVTAFNEKKFDDYGSSFAESAVVSYPQSGERIVGRERLVASCIANPSPPRLEVRDIHVSGNLATLEADEIYANGDRWTATSIFELEEGMFARATCYFGQPFAAAPWREAATD